MKFFRYASNGSTGLAIESTDGGFRGIDSQDEAYPGDLDDLVRRGRDALHAAGDRLSQAPEIDLETARILPPLDNPGKILCIGLNYVDHSVESGFKVPDYPTLFGRFNSSLIGHNAPLIKPVVSDSFDYEGELVAVIGLGGRHISEAAALDHVIGYSIFNDASVRDYQKKTPQWTIGKNFDGTGAFGPCLVTEDALNPGATGLHLTTRLNGRVVQEASTSDMVFSIAKIIQLISVALTLEPGDIIVSGTPSGVGMARNPPLWMKDGDICEVEIEGIGVLRNPVVAEKTGL